MEREAENAWKGKQKLRFTLSSVSLSKEWSATVTSRLGKGRRVKLFCVPSRKGERGRKLSSPKAVLRKSNGALRKHALRDTADAEERSRR